MVLLTIVRRKGAIKQCKSVNSGDSLFKHSLDRFFVSCPDETRRHAFLFKRYKRFSSQVATVESNPQKLPLIRPLTSISGGWIRVTESSSANTKFFLIFRPFPSLPFRSPPRKRGRKSNRQQMRSKTLLALSRKARKARVDECHFNWRLNGIRQFGRIWNNEVAPCQFGMF